MPPADRHVTTRAARPPPRPDGPLHALNLGAPSAALDGAGAEVDPHATLDAPPHTVHALPTAAARALGDEELESIALAVAAASAIELGDATAYRSFADASERIARRRGLAFVLLALGWVEMNLAAMRGDDAAVEARIGELMSLRPFAALPAEELHDAGMALSASLWKPEMLDQAVEVMAAAADTMTNELGRDGLYLALARTGVSARCGSG